MIKKNSLKMATQEHYSLRWNNHQNHILRAFDTLLQTKTLVDVTLVCAETSIRAHKVVLSACSPFFQRVFSETPCKHPVIVLKDFRGWVVQAIVDFMYRGEISVPQERLQTLIQAGESLQVRGLIDHPVAGNTPTPAASPDDFSVIDDSMDAIMSSQSSKLLLPQVFVDTITNHNVTGQPEACTSPMPRRKQARPRRRSGECAPQDLSQSKPCTPAPQTPTTQSQPSSTSKSTHSSTSTSTKTSTTTSTTRPTSEVVKPTRKTKTTKPPKPTNPKDADAEQELQSSEPENNNENDNDDDDDDDRNDEMSETKRKKEDKDTAEEKPVKQEERPASSLADDEGEVMDDVDPKQQGDDGNRDVDHDDDVVGDRDAEPDEHEEQEGPNERPDEEEEEEEEMDDDEGDENTQKSNEGPENLCTKSSSNNNNNEQLSNNNSSNRIVLSLRDIRHLNRPSVNSANHPPPPPSNSHHHEPAESELSPVQAHPLNLNNHSALGHFLNKHESSRHDRGGGGGGGEDDDRDERMDHDGPFMDQMDLSLAHHNLLHNSHAMEHLAGLSSKEFKDFKEFSQAQLMNPLPHFGQHQDGHHPNSPINLPHMPSISSLTMTPPHSE